MAETTVTNVEQQLSKLNLSEQSAAASSVQISTVEGHYCYWQESVTLELRRHIVIKLMQAIIPGCDSQIVPEQNSMLNLQQYALKIEAELFNTATSRYDYYRLIADKLANILGVFNNTKT